MQKRRILILLVWMAGILFPVAGFFGLFPGGKEWFDARTSSEALHIGAHLALFAGLVLLLAFTLRWRFRWMTVIATYAIGLMFAFVQEGMQVLAIGYPRFTSAEYFDLGIDLLGVSLGILLWLLFHIGSHLRNR